MTLGRLIDTSYTYIQYIQYVLSMFGDNMPVMVNGKKCRIPCQTSQTVALSDFPTQRIKRLTKMPWQLPCPFCSMIYSRKMLELCGISSWQNSSFTGDLGNRAAEGHNRDLSLSSDHHSNHTWFVTLMDYS